MTCREYPEAHETVFVGGPSSQTRKAPEPSDAWLRVCAALDAVAEENSRSTKLFRDLCILLQLDPERATADDVLRLVGECVDRATEEERRRCDGCRHYWMDHDAAYPVNECRHPHLRKDDVRDPHESCSRWEAKP